MDKTQIINFSEFANDTINGIQVTDTFDSWRKKTNGLIEKVIDVDQRLVPFYSYLDDRPTVVFINEKQTITGTKTFSAGSKEDPILKIGDRGIYNNGYGICIDNLVVESLDVTGTKVKMGKTSYILPTTDPTENSILTKSGNRLVWENYNTVVDIVKQEGTVKILTTNEILPVGTIVSHSLSVAPNKWLACNGTRFRGADHPDLAKTILNTYGNIYTTATGSVQTAQVKYSDGYYYTLPNIEGRYIIKAEKDDVINTMINRGNVMSFLNEAGDHVSTIDMLTGGTTSLQLNYDHTLKVNENREIGIAIDSISEKELQVNSVSPNKLSAGGPSWDAVTSELFIGNDPTTRKRVATEDFITQLLSRKGTATKLAEKYSSSRYSSPGSNLDFCYISDSGTIIINGDNTGNRFGYADKYAHTELHLPNNRLASALYVLYDSIAVLDTVGELWFMGQNRYNMYNCVPNPGTAVKEWTKAFTQLYGYSSNNKIKRVITSSEPLQTNTIAVIDTSNRLWIAGRNRYGVNGNLSTTPTSDKTQGEVLPVLSGASVDEVILVGGDAVAPGGTTQAYETILVITSDGLLRVAGYGKQGLRGDGTDSDTYTSFNNNTSIQYNGAPLNLVGCKLFATGQGLSQTVYLLAQNGSLLYSWGSGGLIGNGAASSVIYKTPQLVWDANNTNAGNSFYKKIIDKVYTTNHSAVAATYILCQTLRTVAPLGTSLSISGSASTKVGMSVAISDDGTTIVFGGAAGKSNCKVAVYKLVGTAWQQRGQLLSAPTSANESFGTCVAISGNGNIVAVSSPDYSTSGTSLNPNGAVRLYEYREIDNTWIQVGNTIIGDRTERLGMHDGTVSLNIDGTILAVGAPYYTKYIDSSIYTHYGRVKIYKLSGSTWSSHGGTADGKGIISMSNRYDYFGYAIKLSSDGTRIAISAPGNNGNENNVRLRNWLDSFFYRRWWVRDYWGDNRGAIRVFYLNGTSWEQLGSTIYGSPYEEIGRTLSLSGNGTTLAYSARKTNTNTIVRVNRLADQTWKQLGLDISSGSNGNDFGASIALSTGGTVIAISAPDSSSSLTGKPSGRVTLFGLSGSSWFRVADNIDGTYNASEDFGASVALSSNGTRLLVGAPGINSVKAYTISNYTTNTNPQISELWCIGDNKNGKFGGLQGADTGNSFLETELLSNYLINDFWCGNGYSKNTVNFIKALNKNDSKYYLFAAGENSNFETGVGSNTQLSTFTPINLSSDIVEKIIDIQSVSNYKGDGKYTVLHLNDGRLYFTGHNKYMIDPNLPHLFYRSHFTRIK
jgi:hypothetical protein